MSIISKRLATTLKRGEIRWFAPANRTMGLVARFGKSFLRTDPGRMESRAHAFATQEGESNSPSGGSSRSLIRRPPRRSM